MTKCVYFDCPTGISGDMCLGALVHAGVPLDYLSQTLKKLALDNEYKLWSEQIQQSGQVATKIQIELLSPSPPHRHLPQIYQIIENAGFSPQVTQWSQQIFERLALAEGAVHGISPEKVHFHEVGATDALLDIVGTCLGLEWLGVEQIYCSALPTGGGTVKAAHGLLPVPVPAVLKLWEMRQVPVYHNGIDCELVTPTGAAIATTLSDQFGHPPTMQLQTLGLGAGTKKLPIPNILRLWVGESDTPAANSETITLLETQIDDMTPQGIAYTCEQLLAVGAYDVFTQAVTMKKSRTGLLLTVICSPELSPLCEQILFQETTTLGIRIRTQQRHILQREMKTISTEYGEVSVKIARQGDKILNIQPEYEDCAKLARKHQQPWQVIQQAVFNQVD